MTATCPVLDIRDLQVQFVADGRVTRAVDGVSVTVQPGEMVGLVGETGCGKSVTALAILGLIASPPGQIVGGEIQFEGQTLPVKKPSDMRRIRGRRIAMIFQEPMTSLDPSFSIGSQMLELLAVHRQLKGKLARDEALRSLALVNMPHPDRVLKQYPFELSGGMRQRVMIAMALSCEPKVLIADEPTTALDVTVQAQILSLLSEVQQRTGTSVLLITHDLGVVAENCDRVYVMYAGRVVESASVDELVGEPLHPYTHGLMAAIPGIEPDQARLQEIPGELLTTWSGPRACQFATRCPSATDRCRTEEPTMLEARPGHMVACHLYS